MQKNQDEPRTPFPRFDDALAGKAPWITDDEAKAGLVEEIVPEKGTPTAKRHCGAAAKTSAEAIGAAFVKVSKDPLHTIPECGMPGDTKETMTCLTMGKGEGVLLSAEYKKIGETWTLVGMRSKALGGADDEKQDIEFGKLLGAKCK